MDREIEMTVGQSGMTAEAYFMEMDTAIPAPDSIEGIPDGKLKQTGMEFLQTIPKKK